MRCAAFLSAPAGIACGSNMRRRAMRSAGGFRRWPGWPGSAAAGRYGALAQEGFPMRAQRFSKAAPERRAVEALGVFAALLRRERRPPLEALERFEHCLRCLLVEQ